MPVLSNNFLKSLCQYLTVDAGSPFPVQKTCLGLPFRIPKSSSPTSRAIGLLIEARRRRTDLEHVAGQGRVITYQWKPPRPRDLSDALPHRPAGNGRLPFGLLEVKFNSGRSIGRIISALNISPARSWCSMRHTDIERESVRRRTD